MATSSSVVVVLLVVALTLNFSPAQAQRSKRDAPASVHSLLDGLEMLAKMENLSALKGVFAFDAVLIKDGIIYSGIHNIQNAFQSFVSTNLRFIERSIEVTDPYRMTTTTTGTVILKDGRYVYEAIGAPYDFDYYFRSLKLTYFGRN